MIASRFRPVGWVAAVAVAALGCYLVSLRVAAKRDEVTRIETQIISTQVDMRRLETELGTRSRLVQLERWNSDSLGLAAPRVGQYLKSEIQLANLGSLPDAPAGTPPARRVTGRCCRRAIRQRRARPRASLPRPTCRRKRPRRRPCIMRMSS